MLRQPVQPSCKNRLAEPVRIAQIDNARVALGQQQDVAPLQHNVSGLGAMRSPERATATTAGIAPDEGHGPEKSEKPEKTEKAERIEKDQ